MNQRLLIVAAIAALSTFSIINAAAIEQSRIISVSTRTYRRSSTTRTLATFLYYPLVPELSLFGDSFAISLGTTGQEHTKIIKTRHPYYIMPNQDLRLECVQRQGRLVEWYFNGKFIDEGTESGFLTDSRREQQNSRTVAELEKSKVTAEDSGIYSCRALPDPDLGVERSIYNIEVIVTNNTEPVANSTIVPHHAVAEEPNDNVKMSCSVTGPGVEDARMKWMRGDSVITDKEDKYDLLANHTLEVQNVDYLNDLGDYMCVFDITGGRNTSATVKLDAEAYVNDFDTSKNLVQGDVLTLRCDAYGLPAPAATWFKDDEKIEEDDRTSFDVYDDKGVAVENGVLKIQSVDYPDAGDYTCMATNIHGNYNSTIIIRVKDKLAALWPFLGICAEVVVLCLIIFIYERRRAKKMAEEDAKEETDHLTNSHANRGDDVRQRKV